MSMDIREYYYNTDVWGWYDYDSALDDAFYLSGDYGAYFMLYSTGCLVGEEQWNCTAACLDPERGPSLLWNATSPMYTLQNCLVLPYIALLLAGGNLTDHAVNLTKKYQIEPSTTLVNTIQDGWPVVNLCIDSYCTANSDSPGCKNETTYSFERAWWQNHSMWVYDTADDAPFKVTSGPIPVRAGLCQGLNAVINADIGGIGMFVSYLMQAVIVLSTWVLYHAYQEWAKYPLWASIVPFKGHKRASMIAVQLQRAIKASHHTDALVSALVEFQKAQVFFMLAVQIAAIIALNNPTYLEASSWQQLWNNVGILFNLAFGGCLPVVFVLVLLRRAGKRSPYTLIVSTICVVLSTVMWFLTYESGPDPDTFKIKYEGTPLPECGGEIAPIKFCYSDDWFIKNSDSGKKGIAMLAYCLIIQLCLILDVVFVFANPADPTNKLNCFDWFRNFLLARKFWPTYERWAIASQHPRTLRYLRLDTAERILATSQSLCLFATELCLAALNIILITDYAHILIPNTYEILDKQSWSLGQVISVTIWIPVILEYFWLAALGLEEGFEHRIPASYQVVPKAPDPTAGHASPILTQYQTVSTAVDLTEMKPAQERGSYARMNSDYTLGP